MCKNTFLMQVITVITFFHFQLSSLWPSVVVVSKSFQDIYIMQLCIFFAEGTVVRVAGRGEILQ